MSSFFGFLKDFKHRILQPLYHVPEFLGQIPQTLSKPSGVLESNISKIYLINYKSCCYEIVS